MTATKTDIYTALSACMGDVLSVSKAQRVSEGPARFNFRGVDDVVNAVGPVLRKHNVVVVPHDVVSVEHERYSTKSGTQMDGVTIVIRWRFYAADGTFIEASSAGQSADSGDKAIPKAHSVAYRTVLLQALCIPTDEPDPDTFIHEREEPPPPPEPPADPIIIAELEADIAKLDAEHAAQLTTAWLGQRLPNVKRLSLAQVDNARSLMEAVTEPHTLTQEELPA